LLSVPVRRQKKHSARRANEPVAVLLPLVKLVAHVPLEMELTLFEKETLAPLATLKPLPHERLGLATTSISP
jgi:hypothetical protein